jgi:hypothetical protein
MREDGVLARRHAEQLGELADRAPVRDPGRDVRPLSRVRALAEEAAELVERRLRAQDSVRVVVDERDAAQYFSK